MHRTATLALRFLAVAGAILVISALVAPLPSSSGPYTSALSNLAASPAFAAKPGCNHKVCLNNKCVTASDPSRYNCTGRCNITPC
jgi:hypothetical protein